MAHLSVTASQTFGSGRQIAVIDHSHVSQPKGVLSLMPFVQHGNSNFAGIHKLLCDIIDSLGKASATAQGLPTIITSASKLSTSPDQRLYCLIDTSADRVVGLLKTGRKRLFLADPRRTDTTDSAMVECTPICILDFYVVEGQQRRGHGRRLCDAMLSAEGIHVGHCAVDRPSPKMVGFLSRHYGLSKPFTQRNNFTVFESFFSSTNPALARASSGRRNLSGNNSIRKSFSSDCVSGTRSAYPATAYAQDFGYKPPPPAGNLSWHQRPDLNEPLDPQKPRTLPPLPGNAYSRPIPEGRERYAQPLSADIISKNKGPQMMARPPPSFKVGDVYEPPLLNREVPDSYRQLFSATSDQLPKLQNRNNAPEAGNGQWNGYANKHPVNGCYQQTEYRPSNGPQYAQAQSEQPNYYSIGYQRQGLYGGVPTGPLPVQQVNSMRGYNQGNNARRPPRPF